MLDYQPHYPFHEPKTPAAQSLAAPAETLLFYALKGADLPEGESAAWLLALLDQLIGRDGWRRLRDNAAAALEQEPGAWEDRSLLADAARRAFDSRDKAFRARFLANLAARIQRNR